MAEQQDIFDYHVSDLLSYKHFASFAPPKMWLERPDEALALALRLSGMADGEDYLARYPDVKASGMDPYLHYIRHGHQEQRQLKIDLHVPCGNIYRHGTVETLYDTPLTVQWIITYMCNYRCAYCFGSERIDKTKFVDLEQLKVVVDRLAEMRRSSYEINLIGGEPTIYPHLCELITYIGDKLYNKLDHIQIITNGSFNKKLIQQMRDLSHNLNLHVLISLHMDFLNIDHIKEIIENLSNSVLLKFNFMVHPEKLAFMQQLLSTLIKYRELYPFTVNFSLLFGGRNFDTVDDRYTPEIFQWREKAISEFARAENYSVIHLNLRSRQNFTPYWDYKDNNLRMYANKLLNQDRNTMLKDGYYNFQGLWCVMGTSLLVIHPNGIVEGSLCAYHNSLHNIYEQNPYLCDTFVRPIKCEQLNCTCSENDKLQKFSSFKEAQDFAKSFLHNQRRLLNSCGQ